MDTGLTHFLARINNAPEPGDTCCSLEAAPMSGIPGPCAKFYV